MKTAVTIPVSNTSLYKDCAETSDKDDNLLPIITKLTVQYKFSRLSTWNIGEILWSTAAASAATATCYHRFCWAASESCFWTLQCPLERESVNISTPRAFFGEGQLERRPHERKGGITIWQSHDPSLHVWPPSAYIHSAAFGSENSVKQTLRLIWHCFFPQTSWTWRRIQHRFHIYLFSFMLRDVSHTAYLHFMTQHCRAAIKSQASGQLLESLQHKMTQLNSFRVLPSYTGVCTDVC